MLYPALNDCFRTLIARKERDIHRGPVQVFPGVEDSVQLRVTDIHILGFEFISFPAPRHDIVVAANRHTVVSQRQDFVVSHDACMKYSSHEI